MFETADFAKLREELDPVTLGYEAGQQDLPPLEADNDPHEHSIAEAMEGLLRRAHSLVSDHLGQAHEHFGEIHDTDWSGGINRAEREAVAGFDQVEGMRSPELHHKRVEVDKRVKDLAKFRAANRLSRSPDYPDSGWSVFLWGLVAFLFVFESLANSAFLAKGNELGLVGAYTVAFGISLANLLPPFLFFGPISRNCVHRDTWRRALAVACTTAYAAVAFFLNLGVAHYREVSGELMGDAGVEVVRRMTEAPFSLQDAQSWLLFLIGIIFSLVALADGWKRDDAYPGYGKLDRIERKARDAYFAARNDASEELAEIREEALDTIKRIAHEAERQPKERLRIVESCERLIEEFDGHVDRLQRGGAGLIDEYREANRKARSDGGVPRCHTSPWRLSRPKVDNPLNGARVDPLTEKRIREIQDDDQRATNRIYQHCDSVRTRLFGSTAPQPVRGGQAAVAPESAG